MDIETGKVQSFVKAFIDYLKDHHGKVLETLNQTGESSPALESELAEAVESCKAAAGAKG
jgi:F0F1-type ATP synthase alpha subunit